VNDTASSRGTQPSPASPSRRSRWLRRIGKVVVVAALLFLLAGFILTRSFVLAPLIEPLLASQVGGDVAIGSVSIVGPRSIVLRDVQVRSREHPGAAGDILTVDRVVVRTSIFGLLRGQPDEMEVTLDGALFRASESVTQSGDFSFLTLGSSSISGTDRSPPRVTVALVNSRVELGTHDGEVYTADGSLPVSGSLHNVAGDAEWFAFELEETDHEGRLLGDGGLKIKGSVNVATVEVEGRVDGLRFEERLRALCPRLVRGWWDELQLDGRVNSAGIRLSPTGGLWARVDVNDVGITIPLRSNDIWARYSDAAVEPSAGEPRMRVSRGAIEFADGLVSFSNLTGELASTEADDTLTGVPYRVEGTIGPIPLVRAADGEWDVAAIETAPVNLTFSMDGFSLGIEEGRGGAVELPKVVGLVLEKFAVRSCLLDSSVHVTRASPTAAADGTLEAAPILTNGRARLRQGRGTYQKFPYPLEDVSAEIAFTSDAISIESLLAKGPNGGTVSMRGDIAPLSNWPMVDLRMSAQGLPLDNLLRHAMDDDFKRVFDALMHEPSVERLEAAGAIPDAASVGRAAAELDSLRRTQVEAQSDPDAHDFNEADLLTLDRRIDALGRLVDAGPFVLGGIVDVELDIDREVGRSKPTYTTGIITIREANLVIDQFPYPMTIHAGTIQITREGAILRDWRGVSAGGGRVVIHGQVHTDKSGDSLRVLPDLTIGVLDDVVHPALIEAIPLAGGRADRPVDDRTDEPDSLELTARLLRSARLDGLISCDGRIDVDEDGSPRWNIALLVEGGSASPSPEMTDAMQSIGLFWPEGFAIDRVTCSLEVTPQRVSVANLRGRRGDSVITARGGIETGEPGRSAFTVEFERLPVEEYLLNLFPGEGVARAREIWNHTQPRGRFDAVVEYDSAADPTLSLSVRPHDLTVVVGGTPVLVEGSDQWTSIRLTSGAVSFEDLTLSLRTDGGPAGEVVLSGRYRDAVDDGGLVLRGGVTNARFESGLTDALLDLFADEPIMDTYRSLAPAGAFDATFRYVASETAVRGHDVTIVPRDLSFTRADQRISAVFEPDAKVRITPDRIVIDSAAGRFASGAAFAVVGQFDLGDAARGDIRVSYRGDSIEGEAQAFLPEAARTAMRSIEFAVNESIQINRAVVTFERTVTGAWRQAFDGSVEVVGASFVAGLPFSDVDAVVGIRASGAPDEATSLRMDVRAREAKVRSWQLRQTDAVVTLSDDGQSVEIPFMRSRVYGGVVSASATIGLGERGRWSAEFDLVDVDIERLSRSTAEPSSVPEEAEAKASGTMYGHLGLTGIRGDAASRRGRGQWRVIEGRFAHNPLTMPLLQLSQLMLPLDASLKYAEIDSYVEGDRMLLERVLLESDSILLQGDGVLDMADLQLDMRLQSRGRVALLSDIVGAVSDELYAIRVSGPLADPQASLVALPRIGGFLDDDWIERGRPVVGEAAVQPEHDR
jgi:hypothetical protein